MIKVNGHTAGIKSVSNGIGNATVKEGTFISAGTQHGIVSVNVGFKPDLVIVRMPFGNNDTTSYWEKGMSWAETNAMWVLYPAESVTYYVELGRQSGETGIQAINNDGFSFMSNGWNTLNVECEYVAVKYEEIPQPAGDVYTIEQGQTIATSTQTINVTSGKYYLFNTVYGGESFTGANIVAGNTNPIYSTSGIGRTGCIIKANSNVITYNRYGNVSANEYTELNITNDSDLVGISDSWTNGSSITTIKDKFYFLALADGETGNITGAEVLVEHKLEDSVSNGTRFLIVKSTGTNIALNNGNSFYYSQIGIVL